jgi:hypothetical protein
VLYARSLGGDLVGRGIGEIAQHLPADGGVALEQPIDHAHRRRIARAPDGRSNEGGVGRRSAKNAAAPHGSIAKPTTRRGRTTPRGGHASTVAGVPAAAPGIAGYGR